MFCLNCGDWRNRSAVRGFCGRCAAGLRRAAPVRLPAGLTAAAAFMHRGPVRRAVHVLKYRGVDAAAEVLAGHLEELLPPDASVLVPIPRPALRRFAYGTDPGRLLARALGRQTGLPVAELLRPYPFRRSQVRRRSPTGPRFRPTGSFPPGAVLVDDVLTTGATLQSAHRAGGGRTAGAVTLTRAPRPPGGQGFPPSSVESVQVTAGMG